MASNTLSLNKIVSIFRDLCIRHKQINDFGYGPTYNINSRSEPMLFAYAWLDDIGSRIENTEAGYKSMYYTFDLYVMDKINKGDANYDEIISDSNKIINDLIAEMSQHKYYRDMGLNLNGDITMEPVTEATNDNVNGWKATITLKQSYRLTPCNVPIEPITGYTVSLTSNITEYRLIGATGPQGATGPAGEPGATGATGAGANITADNGLTKTGDNIQFGGVLLQNTSVTSSVFDLTFDVNNLNLFAAGFVDVYGVNQVRISTFNNAISIYDAPVSVINNGSDNCLTIQDDISSKGIVYTQDYSTNFTPESLITKRYLTNYVGTASSNVSAGNGLSINSGVVVLGGTLSQNTNVAGAGNELYFGTGGSTLYTFGVNSDFFNIYGNSGVNLSGASIAITGLSDLLLLTPNKSIRLYETPISVSNNGSNNGLIVYDDVTNKGLVYFADYSTNFTPESLITKRYLTNYVATASSVPNLSQVLLVGSSSGTQSINMNNNKIVNLATASSSLDAVNYIQLDNSVRSDFGCGVDGNSGTIVAGLVGYKTMPNSGVITGWDIIASPTGSVTFDVWKTSGNTAPTVSNSIFGPTLSNAEYSSGNVSFTFSTGDKFGFNIVTASTITSVNLSIKIKKTY